MQITHAVKVGVSWSRDKLVHPKTQNSIRFAAFISRLAHDHGSTYFHGR